MGTCVVDFLCDVDSLSVGQTPVDRRSRGWSQRGVECIDVEAQVDGPLSSIPDGGKRYIHHEDAQSLSNILSCPAMLRGPYLARRWSNEASITFLIPTLSMSLMVKYWIPKLFRKWL